MSKRYFAVFTGFFFSDFLIPIWLCIQTNFICLLNRNLAISEVRYFQSPICQPNFTSLVQEIFLVVQNSDDHQHFSLCGWNLRMDFWFLPNIVFYMVVNDGSMSLHFSLTHTHIIMFCQKILLTNSTWFSFQEEGCTSTLSYRVANMKLLKCWLRTIWTFAPTFWKDSHLLEEVNMTSADAAEKFDAKDWMVTL